MIYEDKVQYLHLYSNYSLEKLLDNLLSTCAVFLSRTPACTHTLSLSRPFLPSSFPPSLSLSHHSNFQINLKRKTSMTSLIGCIKHEFQSNLNLSPQDFLQYETVNIYVQITADRGFSILTKVWQICTFPSLALYQPEIPKASMKQQV